MSKIWKAFGEDRSDGGMWDDVDEPLLGYYEGTYVEVLEHVKKKKAWKTYGKGGRLVEVNIIKIGKGE